MFPMIRTAGTNSCPDPKRDGSGQEAYAGCAITCLTLHNRPDVYVRTDPMWEVE